MQRNENIFAGAMYEDANNSAGMLKLKEERHHETFCVKYALLFPTTFPAAWYSQKT